MFTESDVTIYIPYYNTEATIGPCLDAVLAQTHHPARVLVIDDGSRLPFVDDRVEVIRHAKNSGLATARNTALDACKTPLIASLDSDVVADPHWLKHLLEAINLDHVVGAGGKLVEKYQDNLGNLWRAEHMKQHWGEKALRNPRFLYGANSLYIVDALHEVGRYDERLRTNNEDRTISEALYANFHDLIYTPDALCYHLRRDTYRSILHGYWQWHHARGLLAGDFQSPEGIIRRIADVNFGIFRYRFDLDAKNGRYDLLGLDACVPWVFCVNDLRLYHRVTGNAVPDFPGELLARVSPGIRRLLEHM
ncbi:hypothetical protein BVY04_00270, partial [bacterium M21]